MKPIQFVILILIAAGAGYFGGLATKPVPVSPMAPAISNKKESVYDRVMRTGKIRCGYATWFPLLFHDKDSQEVQGFNRELMDAIGRKLDLEIEWAEEASYGTIVQGLATNRYDVACAPLGLNAARARSIDFTVPYFYAPIFAMTRADETRIKTLEDINHPDTRIAVLEGEAGAILAREAYPRAQFVAIPQMSDFTLIYEEVASKKADLALVEMLSFVEYDRKKPGIMKVLEPDKPVIVFPIVLGVPRDDRDLKRVLDATITELIHDGSMERLISKYNNAPNTFLPVAKSYEVGG